MLSIHRILLSQTAQRVSIHSKNTSRTKAKAWIFGTEFMHSFPTTFLVYGEPYLLKERFHSSLSVIALSQALCGLCVALGAFVGGHLSHRYRPILAIQIGILGSLLAVLLEIGLHKSGGLPAVLISFGLFSFAQVVVWPGIESGLMDGENHSTVQHFVSLFNLTWSFGTAFAFLLATPLMSRFGLNVIFTLPALFYFINLILTEFGRRRNLRTEIVSNISLDEDGEIDPDEIKSAILTPNERAAFRWMGWLSNPFAYVAIQVIVTFNPYLQERLGLSFGAASVWCSLWFYVRTVTFELLRRWTWWHYKWKLLCCVFLAAIISFGGIVMAPNLVVLLFSQLVFGMCVGLIYQSSLYYSMAGSEAQGEHGGFHESFIGIGIMLGPLLVYFGSKLFPGNGGASVAIVTLLMGIGLIGLIRLGSQIKHQI